MRRHADSGQQAFVEKTGAGTSRDGTTIGYRTVGAGPAIVLLHGAGQTSTNLRSLAYGLADQFAVHVPDRRGRGMSGPCCTDHGLHTEIDDLSAVLDATGAQFVFGLSAGAVIAMEAALVLPGITRLALYEPPLSFDGISHSTWAPRYERELQAGNLGGALVTVLKGTADRYSWARFVPRPLLFPPLNFVIKHTAGRPVPEGTVSPRELVSTVHYDVLTVEDASGPLERFSALRCQVLLLGGTRSARNLTASLDALGRVLPNANRTTFSGVGHTVADNSGDPAMVAVELRRFFS